MTPELIGLILAVLSIVATIIGGSIFIIKAFIKQSEKTTQAFETSVDIHKDYSSKIIDLAQKSIQTNERGITAINSSNFVVENNTKSLDRLSNVVDNLSDTVDSLHKYTQDFTMNALLEIRQTKHKEN